MVPAGLASAAYSFVRFIGGGLAPYAAGRMVLAAGIHFPFFIAHDATTRSSTSAPP